MEGIFGLICQRPSSMRDETATRLPALWLIAFDVKQLGRLQDGSAALHRDNPGSTDQTSRASIWRGGVRGGDQPGGCPGGGADGAVKEGVEGGR